MARFTSEIKLPSCVVTKDLLESIEKYLRSRFSAIATTDEDKELIADAIVVSITDSFGTERMKSITELSLSRFSDDTTRVNVSMRRPYKSSFEHFDVEVQFDLSRTFSRVKVDFEGANSREFVLGLIQGLSSCVATTKNNNWFFNLPSGPDGALWGLAMVSPVVVVQYFKVSSTLTYVPLMIAVILYFYLFVAKRFRPYTTFDSNLADKRNGHWDWFFRGFMGFLIFSTIFATFRDAALRSFH